MAVRGIGERRRHFWLEAPVEQSDGAGGVVRRYARRARLWGTLEAVGASSGAAREAAERREIATTWRIVTGFRADIDGRSRLRLGGRVFAVLSAADPDGRRRGLVVVAEEITP
ncbi:head-tail adaptor [Pseudochelatococcus lubricantis]|uniref:Head-tail adaptor n=1 Tax=Pseudochelatococcus lubricantis TaxID=1538102 RepID=A0ABX0V0X7_9HYPH|nr:head-tail adaptor protein [Pseudochelatococcus lubricantis]NIJ57759.1 head-tail adaptor [Pseudochelatococcus lubricantis]